MRFSRMLGLAGLVGLAALIAAPPVSASFSQAVPSSIGSAGAGAAATITINANGSVTVTKNSSSNVTTDGSNGSGDDVYIAVVNNSPGTLLSLTLTGQGNGGGAFAFDGDGIQTFATIPNLVSTTTGYEGPYVTFSGITTTGGGDTDNTGTVNFADGGVNGGGGTDYFGLESNIQLGSATLQVTTMTSTPEPGSIVLAGMGIVGLMGYGWRRRKLAQKAA